jgi:hypothetical protein
MTEPAERIVPFDMYYDKAGFCFTWSKWLSYLITAIAVGLSIADTIYHLDKDVSSKIGYLNTSLIALYIFFDYRGSYLFRIAETQKEIAFVDNTFGTKFSEADTIGFYTNDSVAIGVYKLAANNMESCFTTQKNLRHMFPIVLTKNVIAIMLLIFAGIFGKGDYVRVATESLVIANFALELFKLTVYSSKVAGIMKEFYSLFQRLNPNNITNLETAQIMQQLLEYETTVAWANLPLDSEHFMKNRLVWDAEWQGIKKRYNIH